MSIEQQGPHNIETGNVPHSRSFGEKPVNEFDNTTLEQAVEQGLIQTPESPADLKEPSNWKKKVGAAAAFVALGAGAALGISKATGGGEAAPEPRRAEASAPVEAEPGEPEPTDPLAEIGGIATPEQIQYVIDNPVTVAEYPTLEAQLEALSERYTVMLNAGELDYSVDGTEIPLTVETADTIRQMANSYYDTADESFEPLLESLMSRAGNYAADRSYRNREGSYISSIVATSEPTPGPGENEITFAADYINETDNGNAAIEEDGGATVSLTTDPATGEVRVSGSVLN